MQGRLTHKRVDVTDRWGAHFTRSLCGITGMLTDLWQDVTCNACLLRRRAGME